MGGGSTPIGRWEREIESHIPYWSAGFGFPPWYSGAGHQSGSGPGTATGSHLCTCRPPADPSPAATRPLIAALPLTRPRTNILPGGCQGRVHRALRTVRTGRTSPRRGSTSRTAADPPSPCHARRGQVTPPRRRRRRNGARAGRHRSGRRPRAAARPPPRLLVRVREARRKGDQQIPVRAWIAPRDRPMGMATFMALFDGATTAWRADPVTLTPAIRAVWTDAEADASELHRRPASAGATGLPSGGGNSSHEKQGSMGGIAPQRGRGRGRPGSA